MVLLLLVVLAAVSVFAVPEDKDLAVYTDYKKDDRIIGGVPASIEEFPFIVAVIYSLRLVSVPLTIFVCGGTIVTEDWVLTAAHCLDPTPILPDGVRVEQMYVRAGSSYENRGGIVRRVTEKVSHNWPPHDIGLLKVEVPWPLNGITISLARLPRQDDPVPADSRATIMGWGVTDQLQTRPEILMKQEVIVISYAFCSAAYWFWLQKQVAITDKEICTLYDPSKNSSSVFYGDSGGPVVVNGEVVGIVSAGNETFVPDVHTRVSAYIDWIEEIVGPLPSAGCISPPGC